MSDRNRCQVCKFWKHLGELVLRSPEIPGIAAAKEFRSDHGGQCRLRAPQAIPGSMLDASQRNLISGTSEDGEIDLEVAGTEYEDLESEAWIEAHAMRTVWPVTSQSDWCGDFTQIDIDGTADADEIVEG